MRSLGTMILAIGMALAPVASAHNLGGDATLAEEMGHQLTGAHHLYLLLLAALGVALVVRRIRRDNEP